MMKRILVIIPTYNEKENILSLTDALVSLRNDIDILVVDDASPDKTGEAVKKSRFFDSRMFLLERSGKSGRGSACIAGFLYSFEREAYTHVVEMDADFSHDPKDLPAILEAGQHADVVIGSRYLRKSRVIGSSLRRRAFSRMANWYARLILHIPISDYTSGFRCYKKSELQKIDFSQFVSKGYITLSEIAYYLFLRKCRFAEVPITFVNRERGVSNFSFKEIRESLGTLLVFKKKAKYITNAIGKDAHFE